MNSSLLIVEDDMLLINTLRTYAENIFAQVFVAHNAQMAQKIASAYEPYVILLDNKLPDGYGVDLIPLLKKISPKSEIILMTAYGDTDTIINSIKMGAFHYVSKPFEIEELLNLLKKALMHVKNKISQLPQIHFVGNSPAILKIRELISRVKDVDVPILITGETGTGKEMVAKLIHMTGSRKYQPFVAINCTAIPNELFESEIFGYEKGAFTGATTRKAGLLEEAGEGTLFLDEIGDMPLELQAKLLRVLEDRTFRRLGGTKLIPFKARLITATNKNLELLVKEGKFRDDFFFRINIIQLRIPPLRERKEDIPLLVKYYLNFYSQKYNKKIKGISPEAMNSLINYEWPGNIRELKNLIERAIILTNSDFLDFKSFSFSLKPLFTQIESKNELLTLEEVERNYIEQILRITRGNKSEAARILGITRTTLRSKIKKYHING